MVRGGDESGGEGDGIEGDRKATSPRERHPLLRHDDRAIRLGRAGPRQRLERPDPVGRHVEGAPGRLVQGDFLTGDRCRERVRPRHLEAGPPTFPGPIDASHRPVVRDAHRDEAPRRHGERQAPTPGGARLRRADCGERQGAQGHRTEQRGARQAEPGGGQQAERHRGHHPSSRRHEGSIPDPEEHGHRRTPDRYI